MLDALDPNAEQFLAEVRAFLDQHLTPDLVAAGRLTTGVFSDPRAGRRWAKLLARQGWLANSWPEAWGGAGWDPLKRYLFDSECFRAGAPLLFNMGIRHIGPVLMIEGTAAQRQRFLPGILSAEHVWCQGYSEPGAGSDLASLKLRAVRDGDHYVLNGSKIWTTGAHFATHMFCLVRTSREGRKQDGISFLLLDMNSPGLTVAPILGLAGEHEFNQVFFNDVRVPVANRVGEENDGWRIAKVLMQHARSNNVNTGWVRATLLRVKRLAARSADGQGATLCSDATFQRKLAEADIALERLAALELRLLAAQQQGDSPGALSSVLKTIGSEVKQQITELALETVGWYGLPFQPEALNPCGRPDIVGPRAAATAVPSYLCERAATIYSGASEVQRDVIAKRVLGL